MKTFFHVTTTKLDSIEFHKAQQRLWWGRYVCLGTSFEQMTYWSNVLKSKIKEPQFYAVIVPDNLMVVDCKGHYLYEKCGEFIPAHKVKEHIDLDGEVVILEGTALLQGVKSLFAVQYEKFVEKRDEVIKQAEKFYEDIKDLTEDDILDILDKDIMKKIDLAVNKIFAAKKEGCNPKQVFELIRGVRQMIEGLEDPVQQHAAAIYFAWVC